MGLGLRAMGADQRPVRHNTILFRNALSVLQSPSIVLSGMFA